MWNVRDERHFVEGLPDSYESWTLDSTLSADRRALLKKVQRILSATPVSVDQRASDDVTKEVSQCCVWRRLQITM